jgi:hypothetical protein
MTNTLAYCDATVKKFYSAVHPERKNVRQKRLKLPNPDLTDKTNSLGRATLKGRPQ